MTQSNHIFDPTEGISADENSVLDVLGEADDLQPAEQDHGLRRITRPFSEENARLAGLNSWQIGNNISPFHVLDDNVWISFAADAGADIDVRRAPDLGGLTIDVKDIGTSPWMSLSWRIDVDTVRRGRYLCFVIKMRSPGFVSYRPCLRFVGATEPFTFTDVFSEDYMVSSGGETEQLSWLKIDPKLAAAAKQTEAHVFFQGDCLSAEIRSMKITLID